MVAILSTLPYIKKKDLLTDFRIPNLMVAIPSVACLNSLTEYIASKVQKVPTWFPEEKHSLDKALIYGVLAFSLFTAMKCAPPVADKIRRLSIFGNTQAPPRNVKKENDPEIAALIKLIGIGTLLKGLFDCQLGDHSLILVKEYLSGHCSASLITYSPCEKLYYDLSCDIIKLGLLLGTSIFMIGIPSLQGRIKKALKAVA